MAMNTITKKILTKWKKNKKLFLLNSKKSIQKLQPNKTGKKKE